MSNESAPSAHLVCVAEQFATTHAFEPGTQVDLDRAHRDCWELCGQPESDDIHEVDEAEDEDEDDDSAPACSTPAYIAAEHRAQIRTANAGRGVDEIARLVRLGTLPQVSLVAARDELEAARNALGVIHRTPIGQDPATDPTTVMRAQVAEALYGGASDAMRALEDAGYGDHVLTDFQRAEVAHVVLRSILGEG